MNHKTSTYFGILLAGTLGAPAHATVVNLGGLFSTGVDATGVPLGTGATDPHYAFQGTPPTGGPSPVVIDHGAFPVPPWLGPDANSRWISPTSNANGAAGTYVYRTTFTIPVGTDPSQVFIRGLWAADDPGINTTISLNGVNSGIPGPAGFGGFDPAWTIQKGFVTGVNTLDFSVSDAGGCCTGLRVEIQDFKGGAASQLAIPGLYSSGTAAIDGSPLATGMQAPGGWMVTNTAPGTNPVFVATGFAPSPPWILPNNNSAWLSLDPTTTNAPPGTAYFSIPFDMTGLDTSTASIMGRWSADNDGIDVYLNGVATGNAQVGSFTTWSDFLISSTDGDSFLPGINYLTFEVSNLGADANPAGLRWEILSATAAQIPEPSGIALLALGGFAFLRRRRC